MRFKEQLKGKDKEIEALKKTVSSLKQEFKEISLDLSKVEEDRELQNQDKITAIKNKL